MASDRIMLGDAEAIKSPGGTESMSMVPMGGNKVAPNPWLMDHYPDAALPEHGPHRRKCGPQKYGITRLQSDEFLPRRRHRKALAAIGAGKFKDEVVPVEVRQRAIVSSNGNGPARAKTTTSSFDVDEGPRADTSPRSPGAPLSPQHITTLTARVTAGNSSQMSDAGAAAAVVMSADRAQAIGAKPLARVS